jgi:hypothetical protein
MRVHACIVLPLIVILMLLTAADGIATKEDQPLKAMPMLVATRYCYGDSEVFSVWLELRVKYLNATNKTLILDREIGKASYGEKVARSLEDLAAGRYEYTPNKDWFFTDKDKSPQRPRTDSPGPDFVVLAPGDTFEGGMNAAVVAQYENPKNFAGSIRPGVHIFQVELSAWNHSGEASVFAKSWRNFGELVTGTIKTEPLEIQIPPNPNVERKCK